MKINFKNIWVLIGLVNILTIGQASAQSINGKTVTINAQDADLNGLMSLIANQANINIVVDGSVGLKKVTLKLTKVPLQTALSAIEHAYGLAQAIDSGIIHIGAPEVINRMFPNSISITAKTYVISNGDPVFIAQNLSNILPSGTIVLADPRTSSIYIKGDPSSLYAAEQTLKQFDVPRINPIGYTTVSIPISNLKPSEAVTVLKSQIQPVGNQSIAANEHANTVLVSGSLDFIATVKGMLFNITQPGKQVRFKVRVADITPINDNSSIGILLGAPTVANANTSGASSFNPGSVNYLFLNKAIPITSTIQALQTSGHGKILAEPEVSSLNNEKAVLNVGQQYPITIFNPQTGQNQVQFINAGVNLTITPVIGDDNSIVVTLDTDYSQILSFVGSYPVVGQRHLVNVMRVENDETIAIAGLFSDITSDTVQKIPILGDLPFGLGKIFSNRTKSHTRDEIVFMITPHIIEPKDFHKLNELQRSK